MRNQFTACLAFTTIWLAGSCKSVERDETPTESAAVVAIFAPDSAQPCNSDIPFPTDLAKDPTTGRLNVPYCMDDSASSTGLKTGLRTLDGYALNVAITVRFSGAINPDTAAGAVTVANPAGEKLAFNTVFMPEKNNLLAIVPTAPLEEQTKYLVVVDNTLLDTNGQPVVPDQILTLAMSTAPLIDAKGYSTVAALDDASANGLEAVRKAFEPMFASAEALTGKSRKEFVSAFPFTTQTGYSASEALAGLVQLKGGATASHETVILAADHLLVAAAGVPVDSVCAIHTGSIEVQNLLTPSGTFGVDAMGTPVTSTTALSYMLATPKSSTASTACAAVEPWNLEKVVVFAHALGRCKNDSVALANSFAKAGYAVLAVDGPRAGGRSVNALGDQNLDGCPDDAATPEFVVIGANSPNPFAIRDRMREWALELSQITARVRATPWEFVGQTQPGTPPETKVSLVGMSWGGIAALMSAPLGQGVDSVVATAASGGLGSVFAPLVAAGVPASLPGATPAEIEAAIELAVSSYGWALEPADPWHATGSYGSLPALVQVISAGNADVSLHAKADQQRLADAFVAAGGKTSTFLHADSETSSTFCTDAAASLSSLLKPCTDDPANLQRAMGMVGGIQRQVVNFVASDGLLLCDPDITVSCP